MTDDAEVRRLLRRMRIESHVLVIVGLTFMALALGLAIPHLASGFWSPWP